MGGPVLEQLTQSQPVVFRLPDGICCPPRSVSPCATDAGDRRHRFWATDIRACGHQTGACGEECGRAGLRLVDVHDVCCPPADHDCTDPCPPRARPIVGRTVYTGNWVHSLVLNQLLTDGPLEDTDEGHLPGRRGGHWSQSFAGGGIQIGSRLRQVPTNCTLTDAVALIEATLTSEMQHLVLVGVARHVDVAARYVGRGAVAVEITISGPHGDTTRVGATAQRMANAWAWGP
jgi:phage gp46-like protein